MAHFDTQNEYKNRIVFPEVKWKTLDEDLGPVVERCRKGAKRLTKDVKRISNQLARIARQVRKKELELAKHFYAKEFEQYNCSAGK